MSKEQYEQDNSAASTVEAGAKTGKAISKIAKGAATGGMRGAALAAAVEGKKYIIAIVVAVLAIPILLIAMLPSIIFGSLLGDDTVDSTAITSNDVLVQNMMDINTSISTVLSEGLVDVLERIDTNYASSGCDEKEVNNPYGSDVVFNANMIISMYCAYKDTDASTITKADLEDVMKRGKSHLYSFTYKDEQRSVGEGEEATTITVRVYTIAYNGERYFADHIFSLTDDQKQLSNYYASNLSVMRNGNFWTKP